MVDFSFIVSLYVSDLPNVTISSATNERYEVLTLTWMPWIKFLSGRTSVRVSSYGYCTVRFYRIWFYGGFSLYCFFVRFRFTQCNNQYKRVPAIKQGLMESGLGLKRP